MIGSWRFCVVIDPHNYQTIFFTNYFTLCMDKLHVHFDNIIVIGDLNYDLTVPTKSKALKSVCDSFYLRSLVTKARCFTKKCTAVAYRRDLDK